MICLKSDGQAVAVSVVPDVRIADEGYFGAVFGQALRSVSRFVPACLSRGQIFAFLSPFCAYHALNLCWCCYLRTAFWLSPLGRCTSVSPKIHQQTC